jgi:hypothetical protein
VGDWVWLRLNHRAATTIREGGYSKLSPKYFGPNEICEKIGVVSYRLRLPAKVKIHAKAKIHDVFHIVFLKKFEGVPPGSVPPLPPIVHHYHPLSEAEQWLYLIRWYVLDQQRIHGKYWFSGMARLQVKLLGNHWSNSRKIIQNSSSRTSYFARGGSVIDMFFGKKCVRRPKKDSANSTDRQE